MVWACNESKFDGKYDTAWNNERQKVPRKTKKELGTKHKGLDWAISGYQYTYCLQQRTMEGCRLYVGQTRAPTITEVKG